MASPVVHFEIASTDPAGTKRFVAEMFGWKLEEIPGPFDYVNVVVSGRLVARMARNVRERAVAAFVVEGDRAAAF
jgi:predicted enzyme related to lactoylglutathione lyase